MQNFVDNDTKGLADEIRAELSAVPATNQQYCIGRVRNQCRRSHRSAYIPKAISIGPLHHNRRMLNLMEQHKHSYTRSFLQQSPHLTVEDYLKAMQGLEEKARRCYGKEIELTSNNFKKMMLYDGCFIIELFLRFNQEVPRHGGDSIFSKVEVLNRIKRDLILFENQIPFFVLQCLFNISTVFNGGPPLIDLAMNFFGDLIPGHKKVPPQNGADVKHLLDLLRHGYEPSMEIQDFGNEPDHQELPYSATDLTIKAKIRFRSGKAESLLDIKFDSNGLIEIPKLKVQAETEIVFRNLIAFEQSCERSNAYISDYVSFMGSLMRDWDDANLLYDIGIIESDPLSTSDLFKSLCSELIIHGRYYSRLCKMVKTRCNSQRQGAWMHDCWFYCFYGGIFLILMVVWVWPFVELAADEL